MKKRFLAKELIKRLDEKLRNRLNLREIVILGVVLKGLPVAYSLAKMNNAIENFVPLIAQRDILMLHNVESFFPSTEWEQRFNDRLNACKSLLIIDDVVSTGFTKEKIESIVHSLSPKQEIKASLKFAALVLNRETLSNPHFVNSRDFFAVEVNATNVESDWGTMTVPLLGRTIKSALQCCEDYYQRFWQNEKRWITITY